MDRAVGERTLLTAVMDWSNFYLATAGASATLIGLLFIAVQFNIDAFTDDPQDRWRAIARSTFSIYGTLFIMPLAMLIPDLPAILRGDILLIVAAFGIVRTVASWLPVWRGMLQQRSARIWQSLWLLVGPLAAFLSLARSAYDITQGGNLDFNQQVIAYVVMSLFALVLRNSWNLLVELTYEKKQQNRKPT